MNIKLLFLTLTLMMQNTINVFAVGLTTDIGSELTDSKLGFDNVFSDNLGSYISRGLELALVVAVIAALFMIILGAINWITSGGDKQKYESARNRITAGIIGLAIAAVGWALWLLVLRFLGIDKIDKLDIDSSSSSVRYERNCDAKVQQCLNRCTGLNTEEYNECAGYCRKALVCEVIE